ncbi:MAG: hypothetical protein ACOC56_04755 [Atribacterota bacterium]
MNKVECQICGKKLKSINHLHLRKHNITFDKYLEKFPDAETCSMDVKRSRSDSLKGREIHWKEKISKSNKKSWKKNPNQGRTGCPLSEESKKILSEKMMGHEVSEETRKKIGETSLGRTPWNRGLTKRDDERLVSVSEKVREYNLNMPEETRGKISRTLKENYANGMKVPNSKIGFRKDLQMSFRSSWEANYARYLLSKGEEVIYEEDRFRLYDAEGNLEKVYVTDFKIGKNKYIEIKGHCSSSDDWDCNCSRCIRDKDKMRMMDEQYPEVEIFLIGKKEYRELCREGIYIDGWENTIYDPV